MSYKAGFYILLILIVVASLTEGLFAIQNTIDDAYERELALIRLRNDLQIHRES